MPCSSSARTAEPKVGAGSMSAAAMSITALTASTSTPITKASCSRAISSTMMQVRLVTGAGSRSSRRARFSTGTAAPSRLITPLILGGICGTGVTPPYSMITLTTRMPMANISAPSRKVKYCPGAAASWRGSDVGNALMAGSLEFDEVRLVRIAHLAHLAAPAEAGFDQAPGRLARRRLHIGGAPGQLEEGHGLLQLLGLAAHLLGRRRQLLGTGGVLLRGLAQLRDGRIDLADAGRLFLRRRRDLLHQVGGAADVGHDLVEQAAGAFGQLHAAAGDLLDFLGRHLAALGQLAHLGGDDGEALAMFAGARRLDRRVQRQQIGLIGDVVDDADLLGDLLHRRDGRLDGLAALGGLLRGLAGDAVGDPGVLGVLRNRRRHLLDRGAGLLGAGE